MIKILLESGGFGTLKTLNPNFVSFVCAALPVVQLLNRSRTLLWNVQVFRPKSLWLINSMHATIRQVRNVSLLIRMLCLTLRGGGGGLRNTTVTLVTIICTPPNSDTWMFQMRSRSSL